MCLGYSWDNEMVAFSISEQKLGFFFRKLVFVICFDRSDMRSAVCSVRSFHVRDFELDCH